MKAKCEAIPGILFALIAWLSLIGVAAGEAYRHAASGFECPDEIVGFVRTGVDEYETKQPGLGVACKYQLQKDLFADVYIYTGGLDEIPSDVTHPSMAQLREQTLGEIEQFAQSRKEQARRMNAATIKIDTDRGPVSVLYDGLVISSPGAARNTWLWLWPARGHVMKLRMTRPPSGKPDPSKVREFLEAVVRLAAD